MYIPDIMIYEDDIYKIFSVNEVPWPLDDYLKLRALPTTKDISEIIKKWDIYKDKTIMGNPVEDKKEQVFLNHKEVIMSEENRYIVRINDCYISCYGNSLMISGQFEYEDSCSIQDGFGTIVDHRFILNFMKVFKVDNFNDIKNKSCWFVLEKKLQASCDAPNIIRIEPLHKKYGEIFNIKEWRAEREYERGD